jgi:hypothetical protein
MKSSLRFGVILLVAWGVGTLAGCTRNNRPDSGGNQASSSSPKPVGISSSAQVVKVSSAPVTISPDGSGAASFTLSISPGFHINANPATFPYLIATEVTLTSDPDESLTTGKPIYPVGIKKKFAFADQPLSVYEGDVIITVPVRLPGKGESHGHPGKDANLSLPITVRVQACDQEQCYPPAMVESTISVSVK